MTTAPILPNNLENQPPRAQSRIPHRGRNRAAIWGVILIFAGLSALSSTLNWFVGVPGLIFALLFAAGGLVFGYVFVRDIKQNWWSAIPACALFGLAGTIMITQYAPVGIAFLGGGVFLGALSLGFLLIYAVRSDLWWALIPGGTLLSLAVTAVLNESGFAAGRDNLVGGTFLFGIGLTFLVVALVRSADAHSRMWAYIPAAVLMVLGVLVMLSATAMLEKFNVVAAATMVLGGGYLLYKAFTKHDPV